MLVVRPEAWDVGDMAGTRSTEAKTVPRSRMPAPSGLEQSARVKLGAARVSGTESPCDRVAGRFLSVEAYGNDRAVMRLRSELEAATAVDLVVPRPC